MAEPSFGRAADFSTAVLKCSWLNKKIVELVLARPHDFIFVPGQKILLCVDGISREYSIASSPGADLVLCIRYVPEGAMSERLARLKKGDVVEFSEAYGYFIHRPGSSIFIATGTGASPFASFVNTGVKDFIMLHGAECAADLFYRNLFMASARQYTPCLTSESSYNIDTYNAYSGRVTSYLAEILTGGPFDFYLCGNGSMIKDAVTIIDKKFTGSRIFTETFFA